MDTALQKSAAGTRATSLLTAHKRRSLNTRKVQFGVTTYSRGLRNFVIFLVSDVIKCPLTMLAPISPP